MGKMILIMNLSKIRILPSAGEGFPFSVVLFSRLYVVEFWWFPPSPASLSPMYWLLNWCSDSQRNPLSQYVLHRPVIDYLQYQAGKFKSCKSTNIQGKSGKSKLVCSHPSNLRAFLESRRGVWIYVSPPLMLPPSPLLPIFQFHPPRISPQRRNEMEAGSKLRDKSDLVSTRRHYIQTPVGMSYFTLTPSKRGKFHKNISYSDL